MLVQYSGREQLGPHVWEYSFTPERAVDFTPGQYVDVHLPGVTGDRRGASRVFTLTSLPSDDTLRFAVKHPRPQSLYKQTLQTLQPGSVARIDDAMGDVVLPKSPYVPLTFVAGGLGIASFVSILRSLERSGQKRTLRLLYALRRPEDRLYGELLDRFPFAAKKEYISPERLTVATIVQNTAQDGLVYLSGSERFVEGLRADLQANGVPHEHIIFDFFDGYSDL
jgi:ferredoxin-NADP reductase